MRKKKALVIIFAGTKSRTKNAISEVLWKDSAAIIEI